MATAAGRVDTKWIRDRLRAKSRRAAGRFLVNYLGSPVPVLGLRTGEVRHVLHQWVQAHPDPTALELNRTARDLWAGRSFEEKVLAVELLARYPRLWTAVTWRTASTWVDAATGWGLSDALAATLLSPLLEQDPRRFSEVLKWTRSPNLWRRRAALYAMNRWVRADSLDRPFQVIRRLREDPERWVQRAVGTWLRECWKKDRRRTEAFLLRHAARLPPVVITVATERAPTAFRTTLRRKARSRLPGRAPEGGRSAAVR